MSDLVVVESKVRALWWPRTPILDRLPHHINVAEDGHRAGWGTSSAAYFFSAVH